MGRLATKPDRAGTRAVYPSITSGLVSVVFRENPERETVRLDGIFEAAFPARPERLALLLGETHHATNVELLQLLICRWVRTGISHRFANCQYVLTNGLCETRKW